MVDRRLPRPTGRAAVTVLATVMVAFSAVAPAGAAESVRADPAVGPLTVPDGGVLWGERRPVPKRGDTSALLSWSPGSRAVRLPLPEVPERGRGRVEEAIPDALAASAGSVGFARRLAECSRDICGLNGSELVLGPRGGTLRPLVSPRLCGRDADAPESFALTTNVLIYARSRGTCSFRELAPGAAVVLRTLASGSETVLSRSHRSSVSYEVRAAGPFVAWRGGSRVPVRDLRTRQVVRRSRARGAWDLAEDGSLAVAEGGTKARVSWLAPGRKRRVLPVRASLGEPPEGGAENEVFAAAAGRVAVLTRDGRSGHLHLVVAGLDGRVRRIARFSARRRRLGEVDLDARRVVWGSQRVDRVVTSCPGGPESLMPCSSTPVGPRFVHTRRLPG